jgi:NADPH2:quinone reductase
LVRVRAAGVNFFEVLMRADRYAITPDLPMVPGVEVSGIVEDVGSGIDQSLLGMRVAVPLFATGTAAGGYAEFVAANAASVVPLPDGLSFEDATALMVQGLTALHLTRRAHPDGKSVLVNAASGGVGSLLVQLARHAGARSIIAAASSEEKLAIARSLGADAGVDYSRTGWEDHVKTHTGGHGVNIVYETIGGPITAASLGVLAPAGELVFAALGRFELERPQIEAMIANNQSLKGFALLPLLTGEGLQRDLSQLFELSARGSLTVLRGESIPLDDAAAAHRAFEDRRTVGKVVLVP